MNGIGEIATRGDLIDRCLVVTLNNIRDEDRIDERTFWANAETILPSVLGGLLTAASTAMRQLPHTRLSSPPRMADFAKWVVAAESELPWSAGDFMSTYSSNRETAILNTLESDAFARHLCAVATKDVFEGTATQLGELLALRLSERESRERTWPRNARAISERVTRLAPALRAAGIDVERGRRGNDRTIILRPAGGEGYLTVTALLWEKNVRKCTQNVRTRTQMYAKYRVRTQTNTLTMRVGGFYVRTVRKNSYFLLRKHLTVYTRKKIVWKREEERDIEKGT